MSNRGDEDGVGSRKRGYSGGLNMALILTENIRLTAAPF